MTEELRKVVEIVRAAGARTEPPASAEEIARLERELGAPLPALLKGIYERFAASNGPLPYGLLPPGDVPTWTRYCHEVEMLDPRESVAVCWTDFGGETVGAFLTEPMAPRVAVFESDCWAVPRWRTIVSFYEAMERWIGAGGHRDVERDYPVRRVEDEDPGDVRLARELLVDFERQGDCLAGLRGVVLSSPDDWAALCELIDRVVRDEPDDTWLSPPQVAGAACRVLGERADPRAVATLERAARARPPGAGWHNLRGRAAGSLLTIGTPQATQALRRLLPGLGAGWPDLVEEAEARWAARG